MIDRPRGLGKAPPASRLPAAVERLPRAGRWLLVAAALAASAPAAADPWKAEAGSGLEYDSNVTRVDERIGADAAPVLRSAARLDARGGQARRLRWGVGLGGGAKALLGGPTATENALTGSIDLTAGRRTSDHLTVGVRAAHYEVFPFANRTPSRAFATSGADLSVALDDDHGRRASLAVGVRRLVYKPDPDFDWTGPAFTLTLEDPIWRGDDDRAIDLVVGYRLEHRTYQGRAYRNGCRLGDPLEIRCFVPDAQVRRDLLHVAGVRATYTGARVASLGYELIVDDSTSFGGSLVRQRLTASITTPLPARIFATATVTGQLDHYPEPQLLARALMDPDPKSLDDESRSAAAIRLARAVGAAWQIELRWSIQGSGFADDAPGFRRQVAYAGVTWDR